jgi:hypothetical protein
MLLVLLLDKDLGKTVIMLSYIQEAKKLLLLKEHEQS